MRILESEIEDAPFLTNLINAAYKHEEEWKSSQRINQDEVQEILDAEDVILYKGLHNEDLVCCATLEFEGSEALFGLLSVWPRLQGKGHGYEMIQFLEQMAQVRRCERMTCEVASFNTHLMDYYKKMGYEHYGSKPWYEPTLKIADVTFELFRKEL